jgi:hypothetical protein
MNVIELVNALKTFGPLGLFFVIWYFDKKSMEKIANDLKNELKESGNRWYDLGQKMERHMLLSIGALTELKGMQREIRDRLDVLLRRGE